jgi:DNA (cytosine-5)-methyltransferase 1
MGSIQYAVEVDVLPAFVVGADHARERIYFTSYTNGYGKSRLPIYAEASRLSRFSGEQRGMVPAHGLYDDVACLRAFGNAIVPQVAAEVIAAFMECRP